MRLTFILDRLGIKAPIQTVGSSESNIHSQIVNVVNQIEGKPNGEKISKEESKDSEENS